jgi:hypothetical protein
MYPIGFAFSIKIAASLELRQYYCGHHTYVVGDDTPQNFLPEMRFSFPIASKYIVGPAEKLRQRKHQNPVQNRIWTGFLISDRHW